MAILETKELTVRFGGLTAVSQLDLNVEPGAIFSIIGPNGAGKTTVFNAISGIYQPTQGCVKFAGREPGRALGWQVVMACALVGLATGLAAAVASINGDALWRAAVKRNYPDPGRPFSYGAAWRATLAYLRGDLALEQGRGNRWWVVSADAARSLGLADSHQEAKSLAASFEDMIGLGGSDRTVQRRADTWVVLSSDGRRELAHYDSLAAARQKLELLATVGLERASRRRRAGLALALGLVLGSAGAYSVWRRSRSAPDVVALNGIARTFQNIRLFGNMTVVENVLVGMDRSFRCGVLRMLVRTPALGREEKEGLAGAMDLLAFVGLAARAQVQANELAYGDQRRLEIARALATRPRLLLLDEPAAGMNPAETAGLVQLIRQIRQRGITVVLIEHHMSVVMGISDRIAVLDYGKKIAEGAAEEVRLNPQVIEAYLGKEAAG